MSSPSSNVWDKLKPAVTMVVVQAVLAGVNIFYKLATSDGMSAAILVAYRFILGAVVLTPVAYFLERKVRPPFTRMVFVHAFLSGLFGGTLVQNLYVNGLKLTSVTLASSIINLGPAMTFALAAAFRLEKAGIGKASGSLKIAGTVVAVGGAMLLTVYKGTELKMGSSSINLLSGAGKPAAAATSSHDRIIGSVLCLGSCLSYSLWLILQAKMGHYFPCPYSSTALMCTMGGLQAVVYALIVERGNWTAWRMGFDVRLLAVVYNGVLASAFMVTMMSWVISKKGPLYASVFNPLMLVFSAVLGAVLLGENLRLGSVLGSLLIIAGLYLVLWGKRREASEAKLLNQEKLPSVSSHGSSKEGSSRAPSQRFSVVSDCIYLGSENLLVFWGDEDSTGPPRPSAVAVEDTVRERQQPRDLSQMENDTYKSISDKDDRTV